MIQGLINKAVDDKLRSVEFEKRLLHSIEDVTLSPRHLTKMMRAMLHNQDFIVSATTIVKMETEQAIDGVSKKRERV